MKNPAEFWKQSQIGKKAISTYTVVKPFTLPDIEGYPDLLLEVAKELCKKRADQFIKGFIDLDEEFHTSPNFTFENGLDLDTVRDAMKEFPHPFSERRAYLTYIPMYPKKQGEGEDQKQTMVLGGNSLTKNGNYYLGALVCVFHNEELGWSDKPKTITKKELVNGVLQDVTVKVEVSDEFEYQKAKGFIDAEKFTTLLPKVAKIKKELESRGEGFDGIYAFMLSQDCKKGEYKGWPSHDFNTIDEIILME